MTWLNKINKLKPTTNGGRTIGISKIESMKRLKGKLKRVRIMNVKLDIPEGKYRLLNENEIKGLKNKI